MVATETGDRTVSWVEEGYRPVGLSGRFLVLMEGPSEAGGEERRGKLKGAKGTQQWFQLEPCLVPAGTFSTNTNSGSKPGSSKNGSGLVPGGTFGWPQWFLQSEPHNLSHE